MSRSRDIANLLGAGSELSNKIDKSIIDAKGDILIGSGDNTVTRLAAGSTGQIPITDSSTSSGLRYVDPPNNRNFIINGSMNVWQRGTSNTINNAYGCDRWKHTSAGSGNLTISRQNSDLTGFQYCTRIQRNSGDTTMNSIFFSTALETVDVIALQGKNVTLSFYARAGSDLSNTTLTARVYTGTGVDTGNFTVHTNQENPIDMPVQLTTSWQRYSYSGVISDNQTSLRLEFSNTRSGTAGTNDYYDITGVQLEIGYTPTPFEFESYETTLRKCQRYYVIWNEPQIMGHVTGSNQTFHQLFFPTAMRTGPTSIEWSNISDYEYTSQAFVAGGTITLVAANTITTRIAYTRASGSWSNIGTAAVLYVPGSGGFIAVSAEL